MIQMQLELWPSDDITLWPDVSFEVEKVIWKTEKYVGTQPPS